MRSTEQSSAGAGMWDGAGVVQKQTLHRAELGGGGRGSIDLSIDFCILFGKWVGVWYVDHSTELNSCIWSLGESHYGLACF